MKPVLQAVLFFGLVVPAFSAAPEIDFDGKNKVAKALNTVPQSVEGAVVQHTDVQSQIQSITPPAPRTYTEEANSAPRPLSDLITKCPMKNQTEFYKSLVFVSAKLASVNIESIKECANSNQISALLDIPSRPWLKNTACSCRVPPGMPSYLMCFNNPPNKCSSGSCNGSCKSDSSKFAAGYLNMADLFFKIPEDAARVFAGSLILSEGKVEGCYYGGISKHLGTEETKAVLEHLTGN